MTKFSISSTDTNMRKQAAETMQKLKINDHISKVLLYCTTLSSICFSAYGTILVVAEIIPSSKNNTMILCTRILKISKVKLARLLRLFCQRKTTSGSNESVFRRSIKLKTTPSLKNLRKVAKLQGTNPDHFSIGAGQVRIMETKIPSQWVSQQMTFMGRNW